MTTTRWQILRIAGFAALFCLGAALVVGIGRYVPTRPSIALLAALAVFAFGVTLMDSAFVPLMMVIPALAAYRINAAGVDLTLSDAALFIAFFPALFFAARPYTPTLRALIWFGVVYEASTVFTLVANPYKANVVEWVHAGLLTIGALVVGWSIGREGHARLGLTLLLLGSTVIGVSAIVQGVLQYAHGDFDAVYPSWPYLIHKNAAGCILGIAATAAYARPPWVRWHPLFAQICFWICVAAILTTQSRQALTGLAVALIFIVMRTQGSSRERRSRVILLAVGPAFAAIYFLVRSQIATGNEYNSFFQRVDWFKVSIQIWKTDPLFGVGLRWWYTDRFPEKFQPPNAILEMLSTAGLFGLAGYVLLMGGTLLVLWRMDPKYGVVAFAVILNRLVQGQLDLFWVAVQVSIPFLIVGICLGAQGREIAERPPDVGRRGARPLERAGA